MPEKFQNVARYHFSLLFRPNKCERYPMAVTEMWESPTDQVYHLLSPDCHLSTRACAEPGCVGQVESALMPTHASGTYRWFACSQFVWNPLCILSHTRLSQSACGLTHWARGRPLIGQHPRGLSVTRCSISPGGTNNKAASAFGLAVKW